MAHSHAQEFLRLTDLKKTGFHLDRIQTLVDYKEFSEWNTKQCVRENLPEVPHAGPKGKTRIGRYQKQYNLWSVHDPGQSERSITFYRPQARQMTEEQLMTVQEFKLGVDYVTKKKP